MTTPASTEQKIRELGFELPAPPTPRGAYVPAVLSGMLCFTAGQLPLRDGKLVCEGKVGREVTLDQARECAVVATLNALAAIKTCADSLDSVYRIVRLNVFVNSAPGFTQQPSVADAASELLAAVFGDCGAHTRCAIGAAELPMNAPVELDIVAEVSDVPW